MAQFKFDDPLGKDEYPNGVTFRIDSEQAEKIYHFMESLAREKRVSRSSVMKSMLTYAMEAYEEKK